MKKGFTLVEIIISLAIFAMVAVVSLGALVKIIGANKKAQTLQAAISNINFALETMSRELRVGQDFHCLQNGVDYNLDDDSPNTPSPCYSGRGIAFRSSIVRPSGATTCRLGTLYRFRELTYGTGAPYTLEKAQQSTCDETIEDENNADDPGFTPVLPPNVFINSFRVVVEHDEEDQKYPLAFLKISGYAGTLEKDKTFFDIQTTVSGRIR